MTLPVHLLAARLSVRQFQETASGTGKFKRHHRLFSSSSAFLILGATINPSAQADGLIAPAPWDPLYEEPAGFTTIFPVIYGWIEQKYS